MSNFLALSLCLLSALAFLGVGWPLAEWLDRAKRLSLPERALAAFLLGACVLSLSIGLIGRLRLDGVSMSALGLAFFVCSLPGIRAMPWSNFGKSLLGATAPLPLLLVSVCLVSYLQGLAPPNDYDSLMYHLAVPKTDLERGFIAVNWANGIPNALFPDFVGNLSRFALALAGETAAQPMAGLLGLAATAGTGLLAARMGLGLNASCLAALMFISIRAVVWEIGTVEVDLALAASSVAALIVLLATRPHPDLRSMTLLGLLLGIGFNMKYQGGLVAISLGVVLLYDLKRKSISFTALLVMGLSALAVFTPHMFWSWHETGNPIFPMVNKLFVPNGTPFFGSYNLSYGTGRGLFDFLISPWALSIAPMQFFDGMILGAPYLLALIPAAALSQTKQDNRGAIFSVVLTYFTLWFSVQSQQARFLMPVLPAAAALAAAGAVNLWSACSVQRYLRALAICLFTLLGANEAMFVGIYAALRLPAALGLMSPADYHAKTPTLQGANFITCRYISDRLKPGETYLSLLTPHSYYCPQLSALQSYFKDEEKDWLWDPPHHTVDFPEFVARLQALNIRFVILPVFGENRRNDTGEAIVSALDLAEWRFGPFITPAIQGLSPLSQEPRSAVYDGAQVMARLQDMLRSGQFPDARR
ncbi:MAG: glycosyltransferase family 39 protein [Alphaproteobacteria bacterium]|nr:glycosyltransferase family 39 protein [Alphaproteobacteria bacterium]